MERVTTGLLANSLIGHTDQVYALAYLNSKHLASGSRNAEIRIWDYHNGVCLSYLKSHLDAVSSLTIFRNGDLLSASLDRTLKIWTLSNFQRKLEYGEFCCFVIYSGLHITLKPENQ
jgi:WD40 repeat protein